MKKIIVPPRRARLLRSSIGMASTYNLYGGQDMPAELRVDPSDGRPYTRAEFLAFYGPHHGAAEFSRAFPLPPPLRDEVIPRTPPSWDGAPHWTLCGMRWTNSNARTTTPGRLKRRAGSLSCSATEAAPISTTEILGTASAAPAAAVEQHENEDEGRREKAENQEKLSRQNNNSGSPRGSQAACGLLSTRWLARWVF